MAPCPGLRPGTRGRVLAPSPPHGHVRAAGDAAHPRRA